MSFEIGGKFHALDCGEHQEVVLRFPPEASGFLHIGHAKAALINQQYKEMFGGTLIVRFDDTNPAKETAEFEEAILSDLPCIGVTWDRFSHTSDYFSEMLDYCTQMILSGKAYADDTDSETMRLQREQRRESTCRSNSIETNLKYWQEMQEGNEHGLKCCIRAKIDIESDNGAMRDPTLYRCKLEPHIRTGTKYKVYPTYDFACPIVDSIEGVTHALRTSEYNDRNDQYYWICDALSIRKPTVLDYSRLSLQNTLLSKRKLAWFVEAGLVSDWHDPRMPTIRGIFRRGLTRDGLRQFILSLGSSRSTNSMEWDKIWAFNKKVIDPVAPRFTGLLLEAAGSSSSSWVEHSLPLGLAVVQIWGQAQSTTKLVPLHPKNSDVGDKEIVLSPRIFIESADANCFKEGENVTFINWGNMLITKLYRSQSGAVFKIDAQLNLEDKDYKKTQKVTWIADPSSASNLPNEITKLTPLACITYGHLITKAILGKDDDFKNFINMDSLKEECMLGDPQLRDLKKGDIIQLQRKGFYICDQPYMAIHEATGTESPCLLLFIPDGSKIQRPTAGSKFKTVRGGDEKLLHPPKKRPASPACDSGVDKLAPEKGKQKAVSAQQSGVESSSLARSIPETIPPAMSMQPEESHQMQSSLPCCEASLESDVDVKSPISSQAQTTTTEQLPNSHSVEAIKKQTRLGIEVRKEDNAAEWYTQVITKAELLEYYDISGCYILRPWGFFIWKKIQEYLDKALTQMGVENAYFPLFVSKSALEREKKHIADFAPEVAWVCKSGESDLNEPIAIRPTSETIIYPAFAKWIQSHRDLPLKINQWSNVVRWEFKNPTPFLRTREFLWQEGHSAFATQSEAVEEVNQILDLYRSVYEDLLAVPVIKGRKTEREKFPGAEYTTTAEIYIAASGRMIQGATSHHLGQNFSRIFEVVFADPLTQQPTHVYQNSWGLTTRTIGVLIMVHADNLGLVLPPRVAKYQAVIVPCGITSKTTSENSERLLDKCHEVAGILSREFGVRVYLDDRDHVSPGWKFNHWELKGVPVRLEIGFKDLKAHQVTAVVRFTGEKIQIPELELGTRLTVLFEETHHAMLSKARAETDAHLVKVTNMKQLSTALDNKCICLGPFCGLPECEEAIRDESSRNVAVVAGMPSMGAKSLCIPEDGQIHKGLRTGPITSGCPCLRHPLCKRPATFYTLFGRSY